ncbi:hypothetical protein BXZ70DRAFT_1007289 [Cristinia sonorae]|uniref:Uncharacterized protein n=1 Tax=Cristinia sonorae TaxID=1940300 RepID=A0A8K0XQU4_9AGAR|nr:hypothetical protein BXZ70DRAFT_1007289 [Cristinia sonorae]
MRLRNWKETVEPTIEETLLDVHPETLDQPFHWYIEPDITVWIKPADGKWRKGIVFAEWHTLYLHDRIQQWYVEYGKGQHRKRELFAPLLGNMKPDTPEVRELLRKAGVFV